MMPNLTFQYRVYPFCDQAEKLERWIDSCRRLYNVALEQRKMAWQMGHKIGYPEQQKELTELRAAFPEYEEVPVHVLQNALLRLDRAFENFFRRRKERKAGKKVKPGFPRFKARDRYRSLTCPDRYAYVRDGDLNFPKLGRIRMEMHRPLPKGAVIKTCTISKKGDGWYVSFALDVPKTVKPDHHGDPVGIDMGLTSFAVLSHGETIPAPQFLRRSERRLKRAQRVLSRRKKGSKRRARQRERVVRLHCKIAHQRDDFQWKLANDLARRFSLIAVEDLNVLGMVRNHRLAKSISDAAWSAFLRTKLDHAVVKTGSRVVRVTARNTSKTCSACGWVWESMALGDRVFRCGKCGLVLDRDVNAARNILKLGRDTPEVTLGETRASAFRYRRKVSSVAEPRTVPGSASQVA
jgi:putative transposase